jgi:ABC-type branched-subunit amino acid transport system substrate-binding protein
MRKKQSATVRVAVCGLTLFLVAIGTAVASPGGAQESSATEPHSILRRPAGYHGPGREKPDPELDRIPIGLFAPVEPVDSAGHRMWRGASLAVEEANGGGGYGGKPFRLVQRWAADPWRGGANLVTQMVYEDGVLGILGGPDGDTTHLLEQVATKVRVPIVSPVSGDPTLTRVAVPWIFVLPPGDDAQAETIAETVAAAGPGRVGLVTSTNHDGRVGAEEMQEALFERAIVPVCHLSLPRDLLDAGPAARQALEARPDVLIIWSRPEPAGRFLNAIRSRGLEPPLYFPLTADPGSLPGVTGDWKSAVTVLAIAGPAGTESAGESFESRFEGRFGEASDWVSRSAYDATRILIRAIREAGPNRVRIRDRIAELSGYEGVTGRVVWDNGGANTGFVLEVRER